MIQGNLIFSSYVWARDNLKSDEVVAFCYLLFCFLIQAHVEFEKKQQTTAEILLNESLCWSLIHQIVKRANSKC